MRSLGQARRNDLITLRALPWSGGNFLPLIRFTPRACGGSPQANIRAAWRRTIHRKAMAPKFIVRA